MHDLSALGLRRWPWLLLLVMVCAFTGYYAWNARYSDLSYDGAIFCQPVVSLERYGVLANTWDVKSASELHLPLSNLSQGMLSQYILNWPFIHFFGVNSFTLQASNIVFLALTGVLIYVLVIVLAQRWFLGLLSVALFYTFPQLKILGLQGYGEVPGTFYLLLCALFLYLALGNRRFYPWLGVVLFFAVHTKNYLIVLFPMLLALLIYLWLRQKIVRPRDIVIFSLCFIGLMMVLPLFFLIRYGNHALRQELRSFGDLIIMSQYGGQGRTTARGWKEFHEAVRVMRSTYGAFFLAYLPVFLGWALSLAALGQGNWKRRLPAFDRTQTVILLLLGISLFYFGYWYHFSVWLIWFRRLVPFLVLHIPLFLIAAVYLYRRAARQRTRDFAIVAGTAIVVLMGASQLERFAVEFSLPKGPDVGLTERREAVKVVSELPQSAILFGIGWWQAPRISLFSGRILRNLANYRELPGQEAYVVLDPEALYIGSEEVRQGLDRFDHKIFWQNNSHKIYRIENLSFDPDSARRSRSLELWTMGPTEALTNGQGFYAVGTEWAMWAKTRHATPKCVLVWERTPLVTHFERSDLLTATVPRNLFAKPGKYRVFVFDPATKTQSAPINIVIKAP